MDVVHNRSSCLFLVSIIAQVRHLKGNAITPQRKNQCLGDLKAMNSFLYILLPLFFFFFDDKVYDFIGGFGFNDLLFKGLIDK